MARKNKVLVAVDGSDNSLRALKYAAGEGAMLFVLYVQPPIGKSRVLSQALIDEHYTRQTEQALSQARRFVERRKLAAKFEMRVGDPANTIVQCAKEVKCRHIVLGNRGHGAIAGLFIGSVAMKVLQLADLPVTFVK